MPRKTSERPSELGTLLRSLRGDRSINGLARAVKCSPSSISTGERGIHGIEDNILVLIARELGADPMPLLLAAARDRLRPDLRQHVKTSAELGSRGDAYGVAREHASQWYDYEIDRFTLTGTIDPLGNLDLVRSLEGCRPRAGGRPLSHITFRERVNREDGGSRSAPKVAVSDNTQSIKYALHTDYADGRRIHRLVFPGGWKRDVADQTAGLSLSFEVSIPHAYLDPSAPVDAAIRRNSNLSYKVTHFVNHLTITVRFPSGRKPKRWGPWSHWKSYPMDDDARNLAGAGTCRSLSLDARGSTATLTVKEPMPGCVFSIVWESGNGSGESRVKRRGGA